MIETYYWKKRKAGNSLQIRKCASGSTKPRGVEVIEELLNEGKEDRGETIGYLKVGAYAKKYGIYPTTVRRMCDHGRVDFYTMDNGYRMIIDRPPKKK